MVFVTWQPSFFKPNLDRMSQTELAQLVGVRRETIGHLENGHYNPSLVLAAKIAKVFNVTIEDMFIIIDE